MRKIMKCVFATVLAASLLFTMPGMASVAVAEDAQTEDISESVTIQAEDDAAEETETEVKQEPTEEETAPAQKEDTEGCICGTLCTEDSINGDCLVCGAEDADLSCCEGEKTENGSEENKEDAEQEDTGAEDDSTNLCAHHKEHTEDCGYSRESEDGEETPCTYGCRICPIEGLIAALPDEVTQDNGAKVRAQLDKILDLYRELTEEEQEQIDISRCLELQEQLNVNIPSLIAEAVSYRDCDANGQNWVEKSCESYTAITSTTNKWNTGWYVVTESIAISSRITVSGDVYLILTDGCVLDAQQGITVNSGNSLTIYAQSDGDDMGSLMAASTGKNFAGIGAGGYYSGGTITINGGSITAVGGGDSNQSSAGIGGNSTYSSGTIIINGGTVTATGGDSPYGSAGIGGGSSSSGGTITINGGAVTAVASGSEFGGAGIGSGRIGAGSTITINGGTVTATGGYGGSGIGNGSDSSGSTITISGGTIIAQGGSGGGDIGGDSNVTGGTVNGVSYNITYQVTFVTNDQNVSFPTQTVGENGTIERPDDIDGYQLSYFADSSYSKPFDFNTVITQDITIYVKCVEDRNYIASVILDGETEKKYTRLDSLLSAVENGSNGTITLMTDIELAQPLRFSSGKSFTLNLNGHTVSCDDRPPLGVVQGADLTIRGSGSVQSDTANAVSVLGGTLTLEGGAFSSGHEGGCGVNAAVGSLLNVTGPEVTIDRLSVSSGAQVSLSAGKYTGNPAITAYGRNATLGGLLTPDHAYYGADGKPLILEGLGEYDEELVATVLPGTVTVKPCPHPGVTRTSNNNGTHSLKCPYCGYTEAAEPCSYGTEYQHDNTNHWQTCTVCGYQKTEAHSWRFMSDRRGNVVKNYQECLYCLRTKDHLTLTINVPEGLTYGNTEGKKVTYTLSPEKTCDKVTWRFTSGGWPEFADGVLPANLPVGENWFHVDGLMEDGTFVFAGTYYLTVSAASLTDDMVELPESVTYSGVEQKPDITIKQGETTLTEGKDYDVTYSTTDFTNIGTVIVTIKGKGNYTGTVEKTYTIKKAVLTAAGSGTASGTYGAKLSELSVSGMKAVYPGTGAEVPGTWKLTGNMIPGVDDSGKYTATFIPTSGAGNYETLTAQVSLKIEKAAAPVTQAGILYVQNDKEQSYQYDLTQLLSALDNGKSYGTVDYTLKTVNFTAEGYYTDGAKIVGTTLILPVQKAENNNAGDIGTVNIMITSGNYKDMSATITVKSVNKAPVTITGVSVAGREYNGNAIGSAGTPKAAESDGSTAAISSDDFQYTWKNANGTALSGAPKDAGSYLLTVSVDNGAYIGSSTISFVIDKASITITAKSMTVNKGSVKPALTYTISGLAEGETLAVEPTLTCNADMNTAGRYPITASGAKVPNSNNYHMEITYVSGALTVTVSTSDGSSGSSGGDNSGDDNGSNNGNGSGSKNNGGGGQGSSGNNGGGNIAPGVPALPAVSDTNPGTDTETMKPGTGNTARPGNGTESGSSTAKEERPDTGIPFIKGEDGKSGWNLIRTEEEKAEEGSVINVDMNGTTVVPGDIFDSIKDRDITIIFDMGNGIIWSVDGKSITWDASRDKASDIDFTVRTGGSAVPVEIVNNITGEHYNIQLSLAHDGEFGFIAVLSVNLGKENAGYLASLYYYNEDTGELEFICADEVAQDGTVSFAFTHASDYVVVVDREVEEESGGVTEDAQPQPSAGTDESAGDVPESPKTGQAGRPWWIIVVILLAAVIGTGTVLAVKKKGKDKGLDNF